MTYIAAFGCKDGIVMCADTEESVEGIKNYVEKLSIVEDSSYPLAVGGAGFGSLIDCLIDEIIERATKERPSTKKISKKLIQLGLTEATRATYQHLHRGDSDIAAHNCLWQHPLLKECAYTQPWGAEY